MSKSLKAVISFLLTAVLPLMPIMTFAQETTSSEQVLEAVYESNLRLNSYGKGKYEIEIFAVANNGSDYAKINSKAIEITAS